MLVLLNTGDEPRACSLTKITATHGRVVVGTGSRSGDVPLAGLMLDPLEGIVLRI
jgi:hypothetical protein